MIYGVTAALLWGLADLLAKGAVDRLGAARALRLIQTCGLVVALVALWGCGVDLSLPARDLIGYLGLTVMANAAAVALLYMALSRGPAMLAVPLSTCSGAVTLLLSMISGTATASAGSIALLLAITLAAMAVTAQPAGRRRCWRTASLALLSAAAGGLATWRAGRWIGPASTAAAGMLLNMGALVLASFLLPGRSRSHGRPIRGALVVGAAAVNVGGYAAFLAGIMHGRLDETGVLSTLSGAVAACGAALLLRERLSALQYYGLAATAILVPLLAAAA